MTSVERVVEYTELESEAPWETQKRPPPEWPSQGLITFDRVSFSYSSDGPVVLKDMKAMFRPKEKVGIVGRTGAGKSSLASALFRLAEPEGRIYIDGVLTSEIGLHDLRQKMSIIPQVATVGGSSVAALSLSPSECSKGKASISDMALLELNTCFCLWPLCSAGASAFHRHHEEESGPFPPAHRRGPVERSPRGTAPQTPIDTVTGYTLTH